MIQNQIEAAWWELGNRPGYGVNATSAAKSAYVAACQAAPLFERARATSAAKLRGQMAERWLMYSSKDGTLK